MMLSVDYDVPPPAKKKPVEFPFHRMDDPSYSCLVPVEWRKGILPEQFRSNYGSVQRRIRSEYILWLAYACPADKISLYRDRQLRTVAEVDGVRFWLV